MLAYLSMLLYHNWFVTVYVCFLPVGHTHTEDVDGMFGQIGLRKRVDSFHTMVMCFQEKK